MADKYRWFFLTVFLSVFVDRLSKYIIVKFLSDIGSFSIFRYFSFTLVRNKGLCFGILNNLNLRNFIIIASFIIAAGIFFFLERYGKDKQTVIASGLIEGGIIGNLIDRISIGAVIDFINFHIWPVFNLADTFIVSGVVIILFNHFKRGKYAS
ncbi:MAG: signal peptidase II [Candidatus Omnitrophica bacterium]|nr:signal peptidase II [Candidatus Omnitrophota bacterium]MCM8777860.1 signal peptidase II [Candidatus Omnitrophota bacterium]